MSETLNTKNLQYLSNLESIYHGGINFATCFFVYIIVLWFV